MKFTERVVMHLDGDGFTTRSCEVFCDGEPTGIVHVTHTNGRGGGYRITEDRLHHVSGDSFDRLAHQGSMQEWLETHAPGQISTVQS